MWWRISLLNVRFAATPPPANIVLKVFETVPRSM
jgi:hypothetical protein